jgi:small subunit ribosomal protein S15
VLAIPKKSSTFAPLNNIFNHLKHKSMYLDSAKKQESFGTYGTSNTDTGSAESQIALFSYRIAHLTEHLKANRKDYSTQRALTTLVGKRRALLNYLKDRDIERYRAIVAKLGLRR